MSNSGFDLWEAVDGLRDQFAQRTAAPRRARGDVRTAILTVLMEKPMHGYQVIQAIETRTDGMWKPSPGSVYPTLQLLADEGLVSSEESGDRKVYALTESGRAVAADAASPFANEGKSSARTERHTALPKAGAKLAQAIVQVSHSGTAEQNERAAAIIDETRRKLYAILAED